MNQRTYQTLVLLQGIYPFEQVYSMALSPGSYLKAQTRERSAFLHFLLSILDKHRAEQAFDCCVTFKPFKLKEPEIFKRVSHAWISEIGGFAPPFKQEYLTSSPRNMKMFYVIAHKALEIQIQRLVRQLGQDAPFQSICRVFTEEEHRRVEQELLKEVHASSHDWELLEDVCKSFGRKLGILQRDLVEADTVNPGAVATTTALGKKEKITLDYAKRKQNRQEIAEDVRKSMEEIERFTVQFGPLTFANPQQIEVNLSELRFLQHSTRQNSGDIKLQHAFSGMKVYLMHEVKQIDPQAAPGFDSTFAELFSLRDQLKAKEEILVKQIDEIRQRQPGYKAQTEEKIPGVDGRMRFNLIDSQVCKMQLEELGTKLSASKVFEYSHLDKSETMQRSAGLRRSQSTASNQKETQMRDNLAQKLRRTLRPDFTMSIFQAGGIEGQREIMDFVE